MKGLKKRKRCEMATLMDEGLLQQINGGGGGTVHHHPAGANVATKTLANHNNNNQLGMPSNQPPFLCSGCARPIVDQYLLKVN